MIKFLRVSELERHSDLAASMFRDRTTQFRDRMGWDVTVDQLGWETDQYDALNPIYAIAENSDGLHAGSMRFLPTSGRTMLDEIFPRLKGGRRLNSSRIWECTRFCLSPGAGADVARLMLIAGQELGLSMGLTHSVGVFDRPMVRVYRRLGFEPEVLGTENGISAGIWELSRASVLRMCEMSGIDPKLPQKWCKAARIDVTTGNGTQALPVSA